MKNILIIGDSWGVPHYGNDSKYVSHLDHTEHQLKNKGYNVLNFSLNGGSMIETIEYARHTLLKKEVPNWLNHNINHKRNLYVENNPGREVQRPQLMPIPKYNGERIDWIVWFHTEAIRDSVYPHLFSYCRTEDLHNLSLNAAYRAFTNLVSICPDVKTAIIGGQAPVSKLLYDYHTPNFIIEDWRSEIVGYKLPFVFHTSRLEMIEHTCESKDEKIKMMDDIKKVMNSMSNPNQFFDRCHPGKPHIQLSEKLHLEFQKS